MCLPLVKLKGTLLFLVMVPLFSAKFSCTDDKSCSFNGICLTDGETNKCKCNVGWKGEFCESLRLAPAANQSGLASLLHDELTSSWGGSVQYSPLDGKYHMWFSEILNHCGIHRWISNSVVSHAVSDGPAAGWKFDKTQTAVFDLFTHEPIVAYDPTLEEFVVFVTHYEGGAASDETVCHCVDGNSASSPESRCAHEVGFGVNKTAFSYFSSSKDPTAGHWSKLKSLASVAPDQAHVDLNLAPIIFSNHSLLAWTRWDIWTASDWRNVTSYRIDGQAPDWSDPTGQWEGEDPSMWVDRNGRFHILSHNGERGQGGNSHNYKGDCGRHFFSETGRAGT